MARPGYNLGSARPQSLIVTLVSLLSGGAFDDGDFKLRMPQRGKIIGVTLNVGARGGTHSTSTIDVTAGGDSILAAVFDVAALTPGTPVDKEVADLDATVAADVAKDTELAVTLVEDGGAGPTWGLGTIQIDYIPLGN